MVVREIQVVAFFRPLGGRLSVRADVQVVVKFISDIKQRSRRAFWVSGRRRCLDEQINHRQQGLNCRIGDDCAVVLREALVLAKIGQREPLPAVSAAVT